MKGRPAGTNPGRKTTMTLRIIVLPIQGTHYVLSTQTINQVISVLPKDETNPLNRDAIDLFSRPAVPRGVKHDWIEVADVMCAETELNPEALAQWREAIPASQFPTREKIIDLIAALRYAIDHSREPNQTWHLMIHCHGGVSRSVATAYILLCLIYGEGTEDACMDLLPDILERDQILPNPYLVHLADDILGRGGRMTEAALAANDHTATLDDSWDAMFENTKAS